MWRFFGPVSARDRREADLFWADLVGRPSRPRGAFAETVGDATTSCPGYEPGEQRASRQEPGILGMPVAVLQPDTLLVADFGTDSRSVKPATKGDPGLRDWLALAKSDPASTFEVLGYSDC